MGETPPADIEDRTQRFSPVASNQAPRAIGPYSQAFAASAGTTIFTSGQIGLDPQTGKLVRGGVGEQTKQVIENLRAVLAATRADLRHVVRTTVYLKNLEDFVTVNAIYASYFKEPYPARATIEVARLPKDALVEIDAIAVLPADSDD